MAEFIVDAWIGISIFCMFMILIIVGKKGE